MKISFIIPAYNEEAVIGACLESLGKALAATPCDHEVIVVNNASTDGTKAVAESMAKSSAGLANLRIVDETRKGLVWARRAGFLASTGDLLANIDSDTNIPAEWLPKVIAEFAADPELLALSGPYIYHDAPWHIRASAHMFYVVGYAFDRISQLLFRAGSMLQGGNFIVRREAMEKIGDFNTNIEFYGEDTDLGRRINKIGKVKWTFALPMYSSGRRFVKEGIFMTGWNYALNFLSIVFLRKPATMKHVDIREKPKA